MFLLHREPGTFFYHQLERRKHPYARRSFQQSALHIGLESQDLQDPGNPFLTIQHPQQGALNIVLWDWSYLSRW